MKQLGWTSGSKLAYASGFVPGVSSDSVCKLIVGESAAPRAVIALRQLFTECYTGAIESLRLATERTPGTGIDIVRKLPHTERMARLDRLRQRLPGLLLDGECEPSSALVDTAVSQKSEGVVKYIRWTSCTSRMQEILDQRCDNHTGPPRWELDASGVVRAKEAPPNIEGRFEANITFVPRFHFTGVELRVSLANIMSFEAHDKLVRAMFDRLLRPRFPGMRPSPLNNN
eukprot:4273843-Amphidinium_carterae.1